MAAAAPPAPPARQPLKRKQPEPAAAAPPMLQPIKREQSEPEPAAAAPPLKRVQPESGELLKCIVCLSAPRTQLLFPCLHLALCSGCAAEPEAQQHCPVAECRQHVGGRVTVVHP